MRKDFYLALIVGFAIGLGLAIAVIYSPQILSWRPSSSFLSQKKETKETLPTTTPTKKVVLGIKSPQNNAVLGSSSVAIVGSTDPTNALIVITTPKEDKVGRVGNNGEFNLTVSLQEGINTLYISSYRNGELSQKKELVLYKTEEEI